MADATQFEFGGVDTDVAVNHKHISVNGIIVSIYYISKNRYWSYASLLLSAAKVVIFLRYARVWGEKARGVSFLGRF